MLTGPLSAGRSDRRWGGLLALGRRTLTRIAAHRDRANSLSETQKRETLLPATGLFADEVLKTPASKLIQIYLDRWQIEVNHREEKNTLGVGQAQLWNEKAVPRQPVLAVAAYSALLLAGLKAFGVERGGAYAALSKWRSKRKGRPSCQDLVTLLRHEAIAHEELLPEGMSLSAASLVMGAAA